MSTAIYIGKNEVKLLGKNQDVPYGGAYFFTNQRQIAKKAMAAPPAKPMEWISRYGSITVSQVGKELPNGGMNEAGLVVEQTTLWSSDYPDAGDWPVIGELQWIQLLLDTCENVQEAVDVATRVRIVNPMSRLHYIIGDAQGDCAVIEFLNGDMKVYSKESLPKTILANTPYREALACLEDTENDWQRSRDDYSRNSMKRFAIVANTVALPVPAGKDAGTVFMLDALSAARRTDTAYSLVYDIAGMKISFRTERYPATKVMNLAMLDFSPEGRGLALDLQQPEEGDATGRAVPYSKELNDLVVRSFFCDPVLTEAFRWSVPDEMLELMAAIPDFYPIKKAVE